MKYLFQEGEMVYAPEPIGPNAEIHNGNSKDKKTNWGEFYFQLKHYFRYYLKNKLWKTDKGIETFLIPADFEQYRKIVRQVGNDAFGLVELELKKIYGKKLKKFGQ